jgi:NifU-like protein involved in Fe-S cluster formation
LAPQASARRRSPLCGSTVTADVVLKDGRIADFAQEVKACALGQAAAAVLGAVAIGRTMPELQAAREALRAMLKDGGPIPAAPFDGYEVLLPARDYKNRHASILLALEAICEAAEAAA